MRTGVKHHPQRAPPPTKYIPRVKTLVRVGLAYSLQNIKNTAPLIGIGYKDSI